MQTVTISSDWVQTFGIPVLAILMLAVGMDPGKLWKIHVANIRPELRPFQQTNPNFARSMFFLLLMHVKFDVLCMSLLICPGPFFFSFFSFPSGPSVFFNVSSLCLPSSRSPFLREQDAVTVHVLFSFKTELHVKVQATEYALLEEVSRCSLYLR